MIVPALPGGVPVLKVAIAPDQFVELLKVPPVEAVPVEVTFFSSAYNLVLFETFAIVENEFAI